MKKLMLLILMAMIITTPNVIAEKKQIKREFQFGYVQSVVDGDTIKVKINQKEEVVRLLLIDTPETKHPKLKVQPYGKEAFEYTQSLLPKNTVVAIEHDVQRKDKYNRLLAYVYVGDKMVNELLVLKGLARVGYVIKPNVRYVKQLKEAELMATKEKKNIWSVDGYVTKDGFNTKK